MESAANGKAWGAPLLAALARLPLDAPAAVLMRHSARGPITDILRALEIPLSPEGVAVARVFGRALPHRHVLLRHSPVPRCAQTAECVAEGVREAGGIAVLQGPDDRLGGPYVVDSLAVALKSAELGSGFVTAWREGHLPATIIQPLADAAREQLGCALEALRGAGPGELHILVTHDWNVLTVREATLGVRHEEAGWVDFLDGVVVVRNGEGIRLVAACARPEPFAEVLLP